MNANTVIRKGQPKATGLLQAGKALLRAQLQANITTLTTTKENTPVVWSVGFVNVRWFRPNYITLATVWRVAFQKGTASK